MDKKDVIMSFCLRKHIILLFCLTSFFCLVGCSGGADFDEGYTPDDRKENTGAPVITAVYNITDVNLTTPITEGEPRQNIIIAGQNLNNLKSLKFNTVEADLSKTYTMSNTTKKTKGVLSLLQCRKMMMTGEKTGVIQSPA